MFKEVYITVSILFLLVSYANTFPNKHQHEKIFIDEDENAEDIKTGIIGGEKVPISEHPYTAAIIVRTIHAGTAIIINKQWVLTTAWVVFLEPNPLILIRGGSSSAIENGQSSWVEKVIKHPNYTHSFHNDLALIKLKTPFKFDKNVKAIKIANKVPAKGEIGRITGFGYTKRKSPTTKNGQNFIYIHDGWLRATDFTVIPYQDCKPYYPSDPSFTETSFCTEVTTAHGPCSFDNGSPLVYKKEVVGMFSGSLLCLVPQYPAIYSDLTKYKDWIEKTIEDHSTSHELEELKKDIQYY